ncbi:Sel1 repeat protein [Gigaspora margarita]|uniref:Sel1 repeat protein n=1 Tax=Gigaspora margarita TaxID=4874 RepID=A0A8H4AQS1_GIGMA|nr:Sel1 repeat protein [Gigaspora margarita]
MDSGVLFEQGKRYLNEENAKDKEKAFECFLKSAELDHVDGMVNVADCYLNGIGTEKDEYEAMQWYQKSANLGDARA